MAHREDAWCTQLGKNRVWVSLRFWFSRTHSSALFLDKSLVISTVLNRHDKIGIVVDHKSRLPCRAQHSEPAEDMGKSRWTSLNTAFNKNHRYCGITVVPTFKCLSRSSVHKDFLPEQVDVGNVNFTSKSTITLWFFIFPWPNTCHWLQCLGQHQTMSDCPALPLILLLSQIHPSSVSYKLSVQTPKASVPYSSEWLKISCGNIFLVWRWRIVIENILFFLHSEIF